MPHVCNLSEENTPLLLALQVFPGDVCEGFQLARLIVDLEPSRRSDIEIMMCLRDDVSEEDSEAFVTIFSSKFKINTLRSKRAGRGWPDGCNDLWQSSMEQIGQLRTQGGLAADGVLTFEPDCVPLRRDWLDCLRREWFRTKSDDKLACGTVQKDDDTPWHINGNMVIRCDALLRFPQLRTATGPWDCCHAELFMEHGIDSPFIVQRYDEHRELTETDFAGISKDGHLPAFIHGIKAASRFEVVRRLLSHANGQ
jgi:hypothetical protein